MSILWSISLLSFIFISTFSACFYFILKYNSSKLNKRLSTLNQTNTSSGAGLDGLAKYLYIQFIEPLVNYSMPNKQVDIDKLKKKFVVAGFRKNSILMRFFGLKTFIAILIPFGYLFSIFVMSFMTTAPISIGEIAFIAIILCAIGYYLPDGFISIRVKSRKQELFDAFPTAVDLIRVCIAAGMGLDAAVSRVGGEISVMSKAMSIEFSLLATELRAGNSRDIALRNLAIRTDLEEVKALVSMIIQADRFGTSVTKALEIFSEDLRLKRKMAAQAQAAKVPVKMSLPLICCIFPALFVVLISPVVIGVMNMMK